MSFINSINLAGIISRLCGGMPQKKQDETKQIVLDFLGVIRTQLHDSNKVVIHDFGTFEAEEKQLAGKPATFTITFTPSGSLKAVTKYLNERWPNGMPKAVEGAISGMVHGGKGTGKELES